MVYNHILTFTKLATYFVSVVKFNFGNFWRINHFCTPLGTFLKVVYMTLGAV